MKNRFAATLKILLALALITLMFLTGCAVLAQQGAPSGTGATKVNTAQPSAAERDTAQPDRMSYVSIDINPSIELTLLDGVVTEAKAYNDDGAAILLSNDVKGLSPQEAVKSLVTSIASEGYITGQKDASVVITVAGAEDGGLAQSLKQNAQQCLEGLGLECDVVTTSVAKDMVEDAGAYGLSVGRYLLLKQIALQEKISISEAKNKYGSLNMNALLKMIEDVDEYMEDVQQISLALDSLTPEQLQMLLRGRAEFQARMKAAQKEFLAARTQAKNAFHAARDEAKDAFLKSKDKAALKAAKQQIKDAFALAKKTATDNLKQAKIKARADFLAAAEGFGLDEQTKENLLEWKFDTEFEADLDFDFEDEDNDVKDEDKDGEDDGGRKSKDKGKKNGEQGKGKQGKAKGKSKK